MLKEKLMLPVEYGNLDWNQQSSLRHSLRLNAEVVARAWQILGSLVVGVKIILQVVILFFYVPFRKLTKKMEKMSKINPVVVLH